MVIGVCSSSCAGRYVRIPEDGLINSGVEDHIPTVVSPSRPGTHTAVLLISRQGRTR